MRGFGLSHHLNFSSDHAFTDYAHDLEDVFNFFDLKSVFLGGISTGAYVCLLYNKLYGFDRVARYLNIEHAPCSRNSVDACDGIFCEKQAEIFAGFADILETINACPQPVHYWQLPKTIRHNLRNTMSDLFVRAVNHPVGKKTSFSLRYAERLVAGTLFPVHNMDGYFHIMHAFMNGEDTTDALQGIRAQVFVMAGESSEFFTVAAQQKILEQAPLATMTVFKRSGHIPQIDRPLAFEREFYRFLMQPIGDFNNKEVRFV